eukprot:TRINITY_DN7522_c0_g4_i1.p1 TRINITY_DN7522_c0_g4~~TRINITY_DN7522_c0_g4_i1.p1  ORF type:complete len:287 (+),score=31.93 TRINITY_DN7522_c0_g4_i1:240-1100(+)
MSFKKRKFEALLPSYLKDQQTTNYINEESQRIQKQLPNQQNITNSAQHNNSENEGDEIEFPSDIEVTISLLQQAYPFEICGSPPVIYVTQIYSVLKDRTTVDQEIDRMRIQNRVRLIQLPDNDNAIIWTQDYKNVIDKKIELCRTEDQQVLREFKDKIVYSIKSSQVSKMDMQQVFYDKTDDAISILLRHGFLARGIGGHFADIYFFTFQGLGKSAAAVTEGREEVLKILNRRRHEEIKLSQFEKLKLKSKKWCGSDFHLRDMVGKGLIEMFNTPVGDGIRLVKMN